jgi:PAS domain S-box-containing protein
MAIAVGLFRHRPARIGPWLLLAGSIAGLAVGDVFYAVGEPGLADACYLAMFVLVAAALWQFTRGGSLLVDRARLIDLLAFTSSTLLVVWVFVIGGNGQIGPIPAAHVLGALLLVGVAVRLNLAARRNVSAMLLLAGSIGVLASDIAYPLHPGALTETGYVVLYLTWGLAALHPAMVRLTEPMPPRVSPWPGHWAALLGASVATPPTVLLIEALSGTVEDGVVIAVAGGITLALTITRLADAATRNSRAASRERALREANGHLVSAADETAVDEAVRAAVTQLVPPAAVHRLLFATDDRQLTAAALPTAPLGHHRRSWWLDEAEPARTAAPRPRRRPHPLLPRSRSRLPRGLLPHRFLSRTSLRLSRRFLPRAALRLPRRFLPRTALRLPRPGAGFILGGREAPASPDRLPGPVALRPPVPPISPGPADTFALGSAVDGTLICPLWLEPLAVARPNGGALVLTGRREALTIARDALEVLAGQAALALDRISLVEAVGRRDSDLYLRAVIRNTAELMLVVDEDRRIRYASPGLHTLLGQEELSPLVAWEDFVHPDDRGQVRRAFTTEGDGTLFCALVRPDDSQVLVEATYRDLREDRLVQGFVVTLRTVTEPEDAVDDLPHRDHIDDLPAQINRRSAQHKFRY